MVLKVDIPTFVFVSSSVHARGAFCKSTPIQGMNLIGTHQFSIHFRGQAPNLWACTSQPPKYGAHIRVPQQGPFVLHHLTLLSVGKPGIIDGNLEGTLMRGWRGFLPDLNGCRPLASLPRGTRARGGLELFTWRSHIRFLANASATGGKPAQQRKQ